VGAYRVIRSAPIVFVRTARHPVVEELATEGIRLESFDHIYDSKDAFEDVYSEIASRVLDEAVESGEAVYAVPGHPLVGEESVRILLAKARELGIETRIVGSESFIEASLEALGIGLDSGLKLIDALSLDRVSPARDSGNLIYQIYDREIASRVKLALMEQYQDEFEVVLISGAGTSEHKAERIPLYQLDRRDCDHLTTLYVPPTAFEQE
jgi:tetrapyrrole methylase family protein/MazG family protein